MLIQYVRDKKGKPRGAVVADLIDGQIRTGFSLCKIKYDKFNKRTAVKIAIDRLNPNTLEVPNSVKSVLVNILARASKYFKVESKSE